MSFLDSLRQRRSKTKFSEIVGADLGVSGLKLVRVKKAKSGLTLTAAEILPPVKAETGAGGETVRPTKLPLPKQWVSHYTALTVTGEGASIRYVSLPGHVTSPQDVEAQIREHMGLEGEYRLAYAVAPTQKKEAETRVLAAALPEGEAQAVLGLVSTGSPAPIALEVAGLSALNGFLVHGPLAQHAEEAVGLIECGAAVTLLALFNKGTLCLVRKFNVGGETLIARIQRDMAVDRAVAEGIVSDGSFDISQPVQDVMDPFLRQLSISKDFVERRERCHVSAFYVSGGMSLSRYWVERIQVTGAVEVRLWNPLEGIEVGDGALPEPLAGQEVRLAAAVGAAFAAFEEA